MYSTKQLMLQINVIREKAAEAEAIVKGITSDIQRLDVAKSNLTTTIQTLERWAMLSEYCIEGITCAYNYITRASSSTVESAPTYTAI